MKEIVFLPVSLYFLVCQHIFMIFFQRLGVAQQVIDLGDDLDRFLVFILFNESVEKII